MMNILSNINLTLILPCSKPDTAFNDQAWKFYQKH